MTTPPPALLAWLRRRHAVPPARTHCHYLPPSPCGLYAMHPVSHTAIICLPLLVGYVLCSPCHAGAAQAWPSPRRLSTTPSPSVRLRDSETALPSHTNIRGIQQLSLSAGGHRDEPPGTLSLGGHTQGRGRVGEPSAQTTRPQRVHLHVSFCQLLMFHCKSGTDCSSWNWDHCIP